MHVLAVIAGLLLLIFAGGCTIWSVSDGHFSNSRAVPWGLMFVAIFGALPAFAGWKLFRYGMSFSRNDAQSKPDGEA